MKSTYLFLPHASKCFFVFLEKCKLWWRNLHVKKLQVRVRQTDLLHDDCLNVPYCTVERLLTPLGVKYTSDIFTGFFCQKESKLTDLLEYHKNNKSTLWQIQTFHKGSIQLYWRSEKKVNITSQLQLFCNHSGLQYTVKLIYVDNPWD